MNINKKKGDVLNKIRNIKTVNTSQKNLSSKKSVIVFDNDECTGQYSFLGSLHSLFIEDNNLKYPESKLSYNDTIKLISKYYLGYGGIRPYVKKTLQYLYNKKQKLKLDKIFMYTAAENLDNYVFFLKDCIEYHCDCIGIFDKIFDRSFCNEDLTKNLDNIRGDISTSKILMIDDRPNNIIKGDGFVYGVEPYLYCPKWNIISKFIDEYGENYLEELYLINKDYFKEIGINMPLKDMLYEEWKDCQYIDCKKEDKNFAIVFDIIQALIK